MGGGGWNGFASVTVPLEEYVSAVVCGFGMCVTYKAVSQCECRESITHPSEPRGRKGRTVHAVSRNLQTDLLLGRVVANRWTNRWM